MSIVKLRAILEIFAMGLLLACTTPRDRRPGALAVTVANLKPSLSASVSVAGPGDYSRLLTQSETLTGLTAGEYTISANSLASGNLTYFPSAGRQTVLVAPGASTPVTVSYTGVPFKLALVEVANVSEAVFMTAPVGDRRQFIVERGGRVHIIEDGAVRATPFLDISATVATEDEGGLLSITFDPAYASNGYFFIYYTDRQRNLVIERQRVAPDGYQADAASALNILCIPHRWTTHHGGLLAFGPDGYLYLATGDDGDEGDPYGNGQDLNSLHAKLLRLDVSNATANQPYRIPASNPFVGQQGRRGEIWAFGLRNPWRYTFDSNMLYVADVGQNLREEVNIDSATQGGLNYGWNIMEGALCYKASRCNQAGLTLPDFEYDHRNGCSVIGGYVYRGDAIPELAGHYFYTDYCNGYLRSWRYNASGISAQTDWLIDDAGKVQSFGRDAEGELYLISASGKIYKIGRAPNRLLFARTGAR